LAIGDLWTSERRKRKRGPRRESVEFKRKSNRGGPTPQPEEQPVSVEHATLLRRDYEYSFDTQSLAYRQPLFAFSGSKQWKDVSCLSKTASIGA